MIKMIGDLACSRDGSNVKKRVTIVKGTEGNGKKTLVISVLKYEIATKAYDGGIIVLDLHNESDVRKMLLMLIQYMKENIRTSASAEKNSYFKHENENQTNVQLFAQIIKFLN